MRPRALPLTLAVALALALPGCNWYYNTLPSPDDLVKRIPWFDHMVKSPAVYPYARGDVPRATVPGTVPITGAEANWSREFLSGNPATANRLHNPVGSDAATLAKGDTLFHFFCAVCHGPAGAGNGPVGVRMGAPSLLTDKAKAFSDGYLYSIIRYGRGLMPRYGDKIYLPHDRWTVVNYLRKLQGFGMPPATDSAGRSAGQPPATRP